MNMKIVGIILVLVIFINGRWTGTPDPVPLRESKQDLWWKSEFPPPTMKEGKVCAGVVDQFALDAKWSVDIMEKIHPESSFTMSSGEATVEYLVIEEDGTTWTQVVKKGEQLPLTTRPGKLFAKVEKQPTREELWPRLIIIVTAPR